MFKKKNKVTRQDASITDCPFLVCVLGAMEADTEPGG